MAPTGGGDGRYAPPGWGGTRALLDAARGGDESALGAVAEYGGVLGKGIAALASVLDPELVVFAAELRDLGMKPSARILDSKTIESSPEIAAEMKVPVGTDLLDIRRLRTADDRPIGIQDTLLDASRFPGLLDVITESASLYEVLKDYYGVVATGATEVFKATGVDHADAKLLECRVGQPAFEVIRLTFDDRGILERTSSVLHGERYQIRIALQNARL